MSLIVRASEHEIPKRLFCARDGKRSVWSTEYGTVLELRINSGGKLPNFGFVVFDDSEPVQKILSNRVRRLFIHDDAVRMFDVQSGWMNGEKRNLMKL